MPDLLPPTLASTRHELRVTADPGLHGGPSFSYRGATIHSNKQRTLHGLFNGPPDMPGLWGEIGSVDHIIYVLDIWLDHGKLPLPYVLAKPRP
ncbi:hypothetical protein [Roseomonas sp. WA12]